MGLKKGDKVRCIVTCSGHFTEGSVHTVHQDQYDVGTLWLATGRGTVCALDASHFELIEEKGMLKKGDRITCVNDCYMYYTKGKEYEVARDQHLEKCIDVYDNDGDTGTVLLKNFEPVTPTTKAQLQARIEELEGRVTELEDQETAGPSFFDSMGKVEGDYESGGEYLWFEKGKEFIQNQRARSQYRQFRHRIAQLNHEQGWVPNWKNPKQTKHYLQVAYWSSGEISVRGSVKATTLQTLPNYLYMSEKTANQIMEEYAQEQLIDLITKGELGL